MERGDGWGRVVDEEVVIEAYDVEKNRLVVEEEFGEEGEVLREELYHHSLGPWSQLLGSIPLG